MNVSPSATSPQPVAPRVVDREALANDFAYAGRLLDVVGKMAAHQGYTGFRSGRPSAGPKDVVGIAHEVGSLLEPAIEGYRALNAADQLRIDGLSAASAAMHAVRAASDVQDTSRWARLARAVASDVMATVPNGAFTKRDGEPWVFDGGRYREELGR